MKSFHQFWDKVNGEMYKNIPAPVKYNMSNYADMTNSPLNGTETNSSYQLRPITNDDIASHAASLILKQPNIQNFWVKGGRQGNKTCLPPLFNDAENYVHNFIYQHFYNNHLNGFELFEYALSL